VSELASVMASRRMCRDFSPKPLGRDVPVRLADAASRAPSAGNTHGLDFVVLEAPRTEDYWDVTLPPARRAEFRWPGLLRAPLLLLAYVEPAAWARRYARPDKAATGLGELDAWPVPYWFIDGGAALMAVLLTAEDLGLGALLFGQFGHEEALKDRFAVPGDRRALGTIAVGHRSQGAASRSTSALLGRPEPTRMIHRERW
jgi:nitroreductase